MASVVYPKAKEQMLQGNINLSSGNVKVVLVDAAVYTYSASHEFLTDIASVIATSGNLSGKTFTNGVFDASDFTFTAVSGAQSEYLIGYIDTGVAGTSRLIWFDDSFSSGMPVTPNGGDILITFDNGANKVFAL